MLGDDGNASLSEIFALAGVPGRHSQPASRESDALRSAPGAAQLHGKGQRLPRLASVLLARSDDPKYVAGRLLLVRSTSSEGCEVRLRSDTSAMSTMTSAHRTGARAALVAANLLLDVGCSVNSLAQSDFGFDIHAHLPRELPGATEKKWDLAAHTVLVQVKGGASADEEVEVLPARWDLYLRSPTPVYIVGVPSTEATPWIAAVETLQSTAETRRGRDVRIVHRPKSGLQWDPPTFLQDAHARAALGSAALRQWWQTMLPSGLEQVGDWLHRLAGLALFFDGLATYEFVQAAHEKAGNLVEYLVVPPGEATSDGDGTVADVLSENGELRGSEVLEDLVYQEGPNPEDIPNALRLAGVVGALGGLERAVEWGSASREFWVTDTC